MSSNASLPATRPSTTAAPIALALLASALLAGCASAAYRTALTGPDRPGYTFGTATVPAGGVQAEVGYTDTRLATLTYQTLGEGLLRVGAGPNTELRLFSNSYALRSDGGLRDDGMEDAKVGLKQRLWAGKASAGFGGASLALLPGLSIPTGSTGFGAKAWQPEFLVAAALPLSPKLSLSSNLGDAYVKLGDARAHKLLATLAGWYTLSPRLSAFAEYGGSRLADDATSHLQYVDVGFAAVPVPAIQLDFRVGHGMNGISHDDFIGVGISRRW